VRGGGSPPALYHVYIIYIMLIYRSHRQPPSCFLLFLLDTYVRLLLNPVNLQIRNTKLKKIVGSLAYTIYGTASAVLYEVRRQNAVRWSVNMAGSIFNFTYKTVKIVVCLLLLKHLDGTVYWYLNKAYMRVQYLSADGTLQYYSRMAIKGKVTLKAVYPLRYFGDPFCSRPCFRPPGGPKRPSEASSSPPLPACLIRGPLSLFSW
jgi:hypothetical protein